MCILNATCVISPGESVPSPNTNWHDSKPSEVSSLLPLWKTASLTCIEWTQPHLNINEILPWATIIKITKAEQFTKIKHTFQNECRLFTDYISLLVSIKIYHLTWCCYLINIIVSLKQNEGFTLNLQENIVIANLRFAMHSSQQTKNMRS